MRGRSFLLGWLALAAGLVLTPLNLAAYDALSRLSSYVLYGIEGALIAFGIGILVGTSDGGAGGAWIAAVVGVFGPFWPEAYFRGGGPGGGPAEGVLIWLVAQILVCVVAYGLAYSRAQKRRASRTTFE
jgi:cation transporter-like permease